jgi:hypothetical protein
MEADWLKNSPWKALVVFVNIGKSRWACASEHGDDAECGLGKEGVGSLSTLSAWE